MKTGVIIVGVQWGDEGKGKIIDLLSEKAEIVVRSHGGNNAGHTVIAQGKEYKFHLIPSGILYPNVVCCVTGGCVIDPATLIREIDALEAQNISLKGRLRLSSFAHIIFPYHRQLDLLYEELKGDLSIGTTGKGIGPCYADKANRISLQLGELLDFNQFKTRLRQVVALKNKELVSLFQKEPIDIEALEVEFLGYAERLAPYISPDVEAFIAGGLEEGKKVLFEGAHGTYLDQTFGTYPYVTSSCTLAAGVAAGAGVGPSRIAHVVGVVKCYTTRVGSGPLPTALSDAEQALFLSHKEAREIGTTTGRNRRMGWFDVPLVRRAISLNGIDSVAFMKLDVLDPVAKIKICVGYELDGKKIDIPPAMADEWTRIVPIYEEVPGWNQDTKHISSYEELPSAAKAYIARLEALLGKKASFISYGPERENTLSLTPVF